MTEEEFQGAQFDKLTIKIASEDVIRNEWSRGEIKNRKRLTIVRLSLKKADFSVRKFLVLQGIGNALAENIRRLSIKGLFAIVAAWKLHFLKCDVKEWLTSS